MYSGYDTLFAKSVPLLLTITKLVPRSLFESFLSRQLSATFFFNFLQPSLTLHFLAAGKRHAPLVPEPSVFAYKLFLGWPTRDKSEARWRIIDRELFLTIGKREQLHSDSICCLLDPAENGS